MTNDQAWEAVHAVYHLVNEWYQDTDPTTRKDIDTIDEVYVIVAPLVEEEDEE